MIAILAIAGVAGGWLVLPTTTYALPAATMTMTMSPKPDHVLQDVRLTIKVVLSAPATNMRLHLVPPSDANAMGTCLPADKCFFADFGHVYWDYPTASGTVLAYYDTLYEPCIEYTLWNEGGISTNGPVKLKMPCPVITDKLARSPTGVVMPGDVLHITATATSTVSSYTDALYVDLPDGVSAPTNLPAGATYNPPPAHSIHDQVTLDPSASYGFDVTVTAAVGTKLSFSGHFGTGGGWDKGTTMTFTVGVAPTPRPTATPKAGSTPRPTTASAPSLTPGPTATATPTQVGPIPTPSATASPDVSLAGSSPAPTAAPADVQPVSSPAGGALVGLLVVVAGLVVVGALRLKGARRTSRRS